MPGEFKDLASRLNPLLGLQGAEEIECGQFNDSLAVANRHAPRHCGFLARQHAPFIAQQPIRFFDDFHGSPFAEVGFTKVGN